MDVAVKNKDQGTVEALLSKGSKIPEVKLGYPLSIAVVRAQVHTGRSTQICTVGLKGNFL